MLLVKNITVMDMGHDLEDPTGHQRWLGIRIDYGATEDNFRLTHDDATTLASKLLTVTARIMNKA